MPEPGDRAAAARAALRALVARNGFHGDSMTAVAREAGVAIGMTHIYYASYRNVQANPEHAPFCCRSSTPPYHRAATRPH